MKNRNIGLLLLFAALALSCHISYSFRGTNLSPDVKSISVGTIETVSYTHLTLPTNNRV